MDQFPQRKIIRVKDYDYSQNGLYFITICAKDRQQLFWQNDVGTTCGRPPDVGTTCGRPSLSNIGITIENEINKINQIYPCIRIDKYSIMPNHVHMILFIDTAGDGGRPKAVPTVSQIIQQFKGSISKQVGYAIWQPRYYDHIIRNESEYQNIWQYIDTNPIKWELDKYHS